MPSISQKYIIVLYFTQNITDTIKVIIEREANKTDVNCCTPILDVLTYYVYLFAHTLLSIYLKYATVIQVRGLTSYTTSFNLPIYKFPSCSSFLCY